VRSLPCRAALFVLAVLTTAAAAQTPYPSQPIKLIVPYPAGSLVDVLGRSIGEKLTASLKQPVVVDNRAGASTLLGAKIVATAQPDGYTLLMPTVTTLSIAPQLVTKSGVDPLTEFTPIARLGATSFFLSVNPSFPARTMAEWISEVKKHPGKYTYASAGYGTPHHIFMELLKTQRHCEIAGGPMFGGPSFRTDEPPQRTAQRAATGPREPEASLAMPPGGNAGFAGVASPTRAVRASHTLRQR